MVSKLAMDLKKMPMEFTSEMLRQSIVPGKGMPLYLDRRDPELEDPARRLEPHHWQPACGTTSKLMRCLEAVRDAKKALEPVAAAGEPEADKRLIKPAIIPIYTMAIAVRDLFNDVQSNHWTKLRKGEKERLARRFKQFAEAVPTKEGKLKAARDKIAAHLDKDLFSWEYRPLWESFSLSDVLGWVRGCIRMLEALLRPDVYSWTRDSGYANVINLMNVDGSEVSFMSTDGQPSALVGIKLSTSPKYGFFRETEELAQMCVSMEPRLLSRTPPAQA
jgi:hypothetical protein